MKEWGMDFSNLELVWSSVCEKIKENNDIDHSQINAFFARLHPQAASAGFLMLTADNDFIKTWIERHYMLLIKEALQELYDVEFNVLIEVDITQDATAAQAAHSAAPKNEKAAVPVERAPQKPVLEQEAPVQVIEAPNDDRAVQPPAERQKETAISTFNGPMSTLTFENFVIGDSNRMAYSMAVAVAETPGKSHLNPLFIYGKSGLGKTHLMRAIQNYINAAMPDLQTIYVDSAELLSDYTDAVSAHDVEKSSFKNFKTKYEEADVLLIDDVQYFQGKKQTLDIVFQIFNDLTKAGKQIVLSADRAPKNIDIDERYITRFNSGGTFDIQPPEIETKLGIVKSFVDEYRHTEGQDGFSIPEEIQTYIAENSSSNIRELKSAVTKVIYQMTLTNRPNITLDEVKQLLENHFSGGASKKLSVADIQKEVETFYKVSHADLVGKKRTRNVAYARQVAIYLSRSMLDLPYADIGKKFGGKDHSTMMYSFTNIEEKMKENRELREEIETLKQLIKEA